MKEITNHNFGPLIAYLLPGFVTLWGISCVSPTVQQWLSVTDGSSGSPTIGGLLFTTLASSIAGMTVSAIRFCTIDRLFDSTGLKRPVWDEAQLQQNLPAFEALVENHYRHYQFYANTMVAAAIALVLHQVSLPHPTRFSLPLILTFIVLEIMFWFTARNTLSEYFRRTSKLLSPIRKDINMANGHAPGSKDQPQDKAKPAEQKPTGSTKNKQPKADKSGDSK